jgi:hypothetical protein
MVFFINEVNSAKDWETTIERVMNTDFPCVSAADENNLDSLLSYDIPYYPVVNNNGLI